jgi:O-Antigen ligase
MPSARELLGSSLVPLGGGLALGGLVVLIELQGAGDMPAPVGAAIVLAGVAAALAPLRIGLPVAIVLAAFEGFFADFVGGGATLWEEAFTAVLVARAAIYDPPSRTELGVGALVALGFGLYVVTGTGLEPAAYGAKLLVLFALVGWALARLEPTRRDWWAMYQGLAFVVAASVVIAIWQRAYGSDGLIELGLEYGASIRQVGEGLRAFAGFNHAAPFAYTMATAALCWLALALCGERRQALLTVWVPVLAVAGMTLSLSRTAFVAAAAGAFIVAIARRGGGTTLLAGFAVGAVAIVLTVAPSSASFLGAGFTGNTESASERFDLWSERASDLTLLGQGPASAGSALLKVEPEREGDPNETDLPQLLRRGVVDNQYLAWLYQYGFLGGLLICAAWIGFLGWVALVRTSAVAEGVAAQLGAGFALIAGMSVNIWEEFPMNLLLALLIGLALGSGALQKRAPSPNIRPGLSTSAAGR